MFFAMWEQQHKRRLGDIEKNDKGEMIVFTVQYNLKFKKRAKLLFTREFTEIMGQFWVEFELVV